MRGFDPEFIDIVDYILRITRRIWEGKRVQLCLDYYSDDCPVYTLAGLAVGAQEVTDNTLATQHAFPDRTLQADAVICSGNQIDGYHTSHLIYSEMTNLGPSDLGPATGKKAAIFVIAHCIVRENRIIEEWLVRDNALLVTQLGLDIEQVVQQKARQAVPERDRLWRDSEFARLNNAHSCSTASLAQQLVIDSLTHLLGAQDRSFIHHTYAAAATVHAARGQTLRGHQAIGDFYLSLGAVLSDVRFCVDHVCEQSYRVHPGDTEAGVHVAARWALSAQHTSDGQYGAASNAPLLIIGESHCHVIDGRIVQEWTVFDDLAVRTQIARAHLSG